MPNRDYPGSKWWRCDFHVHSPGSYDYGTPDTSAENWIDAALAAHLDCVAVTDHNTGSFIDSVNRVLETRRTTGQPCPIVFAGAEITVQGVHILAIFEPGTSSAHLSAHLASCGVLAGQQGVGGAYSHRTIEQVVHQIRVEDGVAIAAHIDQASGLWAEKEPGQEFLSPIRSEDLFAVEIVDPVSEAVTRVGTENHHRTHHLPIFQGSDAHRLSDIGIRSTWVKIATPSIEGLRLACIDGILSVKPYAADDPIGPSKHAANIIDSITVGNCELMGRPVDVTIPFSPYFNSIIGGRGTGKSTVVEFLRNALHRTDEKRDLPQELSKQLLPFRQVKTERTAGLLLDNSRIQVVYRKGNRLLRASFVSGGQEPRLEIQNDGGEWEDAPGELRQQLPVSIFSQRHVFSMAVEPRGLLAYIDNHPDVDRDKWEDRRETLEDEYLARAGELRGLQGRLDQKKRAEGELANVYAALQEYEDNPDVKAYEDSAKLTTAVDDAILKLREAVTHSRQALEEVGLLEISDSPSSVNLEAIEYLKLHFSVLAREVERRQKVIVKLHGEIEDLVHIFEQRLEDSVWNREVDRIKQAYEAWTAENVTEGQEAPTHDVLLMEKVKLEAELVDYASLAGEETTIREEMKSAAESIAQHRVSLSESREALLNKLLANNDTLRANLTKYGDVNQAEVSLRDVLNIPSHQFAGVFRNNDGGGIIDQAYDGQDGVDAASAIRQNLRVIAETGSKDGVKDARFSSKMQMTLENTPETIDRIDVWYPEDLLQVEFNSHGRWAPLSQGSPGQRSAALLSLILSSGKEPLILDQPEDDLDNTKIYEMIVKLVRERKVDRQLIIVTHNANIVVNGDSELVTAMDFRTGQLQVVEQGGLQELSVRKKICEILEGGKEAFKLRYRRIVLD